MVTGGSSCGVRRTTAVAAADVVVASSTTSATAVCIHTDSVLGYQQYHPVNRSMESTPLKLQAAPLSPFS